MAQIPIFIRLSIKSLILLSVLLSGFYSPLQARASYSLSSLTTNTAEAADNSDSTTSKVTTTSQNIDLPSAVLSSASSTSVGGDTDSMIVDKSALMAAAGPLGTIADIDNELSAGTDNISVYTVRSGDTIGKIANMFGVSVNTIIWGNDLKGPKDIKVGQDLVILPVNGIKYTIKKGDTIAGIAKKYKGDVDEITKFNDLTKGAKLVVGDEIIIPNGEAVPVATPVTTGIHIVSKVIKTFIDNSIDSLAYYIRPVVHGRKTQGLHGKNGIDIAPDCHCAGKEPLLAAAAGNVLVAKTGGWNGGYGNYVVISHPNGTQTLYGHMYSVEVRPGEPVSQGEEIGILGSSGNSTGPHVHFEIRGAPNPF